MSDSYEEIKIASDGLDSRTSKAGDPNGDGLPKRPVYDPKRMRSSSSDKMDLQPTVPIKEKQGWT